MAFLIEAFSMGTLAATAPSPHNLKLGLMSVDRTQRSRVLAFCLGALAVDLLIVLLSLALGQWQSSRTVLTRGLRILGSLFYLYTAFKLLRTPARKILADAPTMSTAYGDFGAGALVQLFNPNPFLFWCLIGGPRMVELGTLAALLYLAAFLLCAYGLKLVLAYGLMRLNRANQLLRSLPTRMVLSTLLVGLAVNGALAALDFPAKP
ncbi:MAG TPA: LysE family transporter [Bdellovibrionota bacterium]|jgi:threonine/homoserine/homoserine lactone efflux protein|nr:LysE family transporter [Bdellovibrionota bacterium]